MRRCMKAVSVALVAAWLAVSCGGGGDDISEEALQAAQGLVAALAVQPSSSISFYGPVAAGTVLSAVLPDGTRSLAVPEAAGSYYVFLIDDMPGFKFGHAARWAWYEVGSGQYGELAAGWWPMISEGASSYILGEQSRTKVSGVSAGFGRADSYGLAARGSEGAAAVPARAGVSPAGEDQAGASKIAVVLDGGGKGGSTMARDCDSIA